MGNTSSSPEGLSLEEFKDHVFSQAVFFVAKYANHKLEFKPASKCTADYLPKVRQQNFESIINYYQSGAGDNDQCIENYLNKHVLNSLENTTRFHKILMTKLSQDFEDLEEEEEESDITADLASVASNVQQFYEAYTGVGTEKKPAHTPSRTPTVQSGGKGQRITDQRARTIARETDRAAKQSSVLTKEPESLETVSVSKSVKQPARKNTKSAEPDDIVSASQFSNDSGTFDENYEISEHTIPESVWDKKRHNLVSELHKEKQQEADGGPSSDDEMPSRCLVSNV
jgi:hypothetical protein